MKDFSKNNHGYPIAFILILMALASILDLFFIPCYASPLTPLEPANMHALVEKTIFRISVMSVDVNLGAEEQKRLHALIKGQPYSDSLADSISNFLLNTRAAEIKIKFLRNIGFDPFISKSITQTRCLYEAKIVDFSEFENVSKNVRKWFSFLEQRGIRENDLLTYQINETSLRTTYKSQEAQILLDSTINGNGPWKGVLGGYFSSCSDAHPLLIQSLFNK